jgi:hypothetical protein
LGKAPIFFTRLGVYTVAPDLESALEHLERKVSQAEKAGTLTLILTLI